ncbi:reverse transcriptase domain-containing protein [Tanacetum coccineum]|uniref:Reverse transcriptase domain-containing protein n=1 Tax=Tanacetum coccineum TaxID=301880 RepID=A0ABQ4WEC8_9ASTR
MILKAELNDDETWLCSNNVLKQCVARSEILEILVHCYSGPTGGHHSTSITGRKVYEFRFFWPSIFKDAKDYMMRCDASQRSGNISSRIAVDYVSKWVEAQALPTNDARVVIQFLRKLFARFGVPKALITKTISWKLNELMGSSKRWSITRTPASQEEKLRKWHDLGSEGIKTSTVGEGVAIFTLDLRCTGISSIKVEVHDHDGDITQPLITSILTHFYCRGEPLIRAPTSSYAMPLIETRTIFSMSSSLEVVDLHSDDSHTTVRANCRLPRHQTLVVSRSRDSMLMSDMWWHERLNNSPEVLVPEHPALKVFRGRESFQMVGYKKGLSKVSSSLISLNRGSFDVIVGMDWLSKRKFVIVCHEKVVRIPLEDDEIRRVHDERTQGVVKTLLNTKTRVSYDLVIFREEHQCRLLRKGAWSSFEVSFGITEEGEVSEVRTRILTIQRETSKVENAENAMRDLVDQQMEREQMMVVTLWN